MSDYGQLEARLEEYHDFPGPFELKVIGPNTETFELDIRTTTEARFPGVTIEISKRESAKGRHASFAVRLIFPSARSVCELYDDLRTLEGLKMLL